MLYYFDIIVHNEPMSVILADMDHYDTYEHMRHIGFCHAGSQAAARGIIAAKFVRESITLDDSESSLDFVEYNNFTRLDGEIVSVRDSVNFI